MMEALCQNHIFHRCGQWYQIKNTH